MSTPIRFRRLDPTISVPEYKTAGAVAFDIAVNEETLLAPQERKILSTGLIIEVPKGHALILASRSSNAKKGIGLANSIGVIDEDYCGPSDEIRLAVINIGSEPVSIKKGDRIAQGLIIPIVKGIFEETLGAEGPSRGGFGTTGT